jgi:curved DNA-binding protein CbpA
MTTFDPYEELGLPRDASTEEIKRAGKRRRKKTHPDAGGSVDAFNRTSRALVVLSDPNLRARYDATGAMGDEPTENADRAAALGIIQAFVETALNKYITNLDPADDPRRRDLLSEFRLQMVNEIAQAEQTVEAGKIIRETLVDIAARFKSTDPARPIERMLENRLRQHDAKTIEVGDAARVRRLAIEIVDKYAFRFDAPAELKGRDHGRVGRVRMR